MDAAACTDPATGSAGGPLPWAWREPEVGSMCCDPVPLSPRILVPQRRAESEHPQDVCPEVPKGAVQRATTSAGSHEEAVSTQVPGVSGSWASSENRPEGCGWRIGEDGEGRAPSACVLGRIGGNTEAGLEVRGGAGKPGRRRCGHRPVDPRETVQEQRQGLVGGDGAEGSGGGKVTI